MTTNCGGSAPDNTFGNGPVSGSGGTSGVGAGGGGPAGDASAGSLVTNPGGMNGGQIVLGDGEVCAGQVASAEAVPLYMFIMLDQSISMAEPVVPNSPQTRWQAVSQAIIDFLNSPQTTQLSVGIQYFGLPAADGGFGVSSCDPNAYAVPAVEIGSISDPMIVAALTASIQAHGPSTQTPTAPAVAGAILHAQTWAAAHADRPTIVVLATDGFPTECDPRDTQVIAQQIVRPAASPAEASASPPIRTFVIAAGGGAVGLDAIAGAGGTGSPFVVMDSANTGEQITQTLVNISHTKLACTYKIPVPDGGLDPSLVNVRLTRSGSAAVLLNYVRPGTICTSAGGFYYDDMTHPTTLTLCPATCDSLVTGQIEIVVGCPTRGPN